MCLEFRASIDQFNLALRLSQSRLLLLHTLIDRAALDSSRAVIAHSYLC